MNATFEQIRGLAAIRLAESQALPEAVTECAWACGWLEACSYPGLRMLEEALIETAVDDQRPALELDTMGLDLRYISCVFTAPRIAALAIERQRIFLRNVRHGLYLLPFSVRANIGIGCPVDPAFALGGERTKDPYAEKRALAERSGIAVDDALWAHLSQEKDLSFS